MSGGAANTLTMQFNGGDTVNITDPGADITPSTAMGNTTNYTIYDDARTPTW